MADAPLDEIQWKSPEFIQERGLHTGNVLEYFSLSPFYDRTANNQILMMQFQFQQIQIPPGSTFHEFFQNRLAEMVGVEFIIAYNREPDFWIIRKQKRLGPTRTESLEDYYVIGANIYQAPKIYDVINSRLLAGVLAMKNSMESLHNMTNYQISDGGHSYNNKKQLSVTQTTSKDQPVSTAKHSLTAPTPSIAPTPAGITTGGGATNPSSSTNGPMATFSSIEVTAGALDNLLNNVVKSSNLSSAPSANSKLSFGGSSNNGVDIPTDGDVTSIYLDDIPLYGKGSTVEMLGLKLHPELEEELRHQ